MCPVARQHLPERLYVASVVAAVSSGLASGCLSFPPTQVLLFVQVLLMPWLALVHLASSHLLLLAWGACAVFAPLALVLRSDRSWGSRHAGSSSSVGPPINTRSAPLPTPGGAPEPHPAQFTTTRPPAARHHAATEHTAHTQLLVLVRLLSCTAAAAWLRAAPALVGGGLQQPGVVTPLIYLWSCWQASLLLLPVQTQACVCLVEWTCSMFIAHHLHPAAFSQPWMALSHVAGSAWLVLGQPLLASILWQRLQAYYGTSNPGRGVVLVLQPSQLAATARAGSSSKGTSSSTSKQRVPGLAPTKGVLEDSAYHGAGLQDLAMATLAEEAGPDTTGTTQTVAAHGASAAASSDPEAVADEENAHGGMPEQLHVQIVALLGQERANSIAAVAAAAASRAAADAADGKVLLQAPASYTPVTVLVPVSIKVRTAHSKAQQLQPQLQSILATCVHRASAAGQPTVLAQSACFPGCVQLLASVYRVREPSGAARDSLLGGIPIDVITTTSSSVNSRGPGGEQQLVQLLADAVTSDSAEQGLSVAAPAVECPQQWEGAQQRHPPVDVSAGSVGARVQFGAGSRSPPSGVAAAAGSSQGRPVPGLKLQWQEPVVLPAQQVAEGALVLMLEGIQVMNNSSNAGSSGGGVGRSIHEALHTVDQHHGSGEHIMQQQLLQGEEEQEQEQERPQYCRLLLFSQQRVWHEARVPLQDTIRVHLPPLPYGSYYMALLPSGTTPAAAGVGTQTRLPAGPADSDAARPAELQSPQASLLMLEPLLVLPPRVAEELQQLWEGVVGAVASAPATGAAAAAAAAVSNHEARLPTAADAKGVAWQHMMCGLLHDIAAVMACAQHASSEASAAESAARGAAGPALPVVSGLQASQGGGDVSDMVVLQQVLQPLLHFVAKHQMWAVAAFLVDELRRCSSTAAAAAAAAAAGASAGRALPAGPAPSGSRQAAMRAAAAARHDDTCRRDQQGGARPQYGLQHRRVSGVPGIRRRHGRGPHTGGTYTDQSSDSSSEGEGPQAARQAPQPRASWFGMGVFRRPAAQQRKPKGCGSSLASSGYTAADIQHEQAQEWHMSLLQLLWGFRSPALEAAYVQYVYQHTSRGLDVLASLYPLAIVCGSNYLSTVVEAAARLGWLLALRSHVAEVLVLLTWGGVSVLAMALFMLCGAPAAWHEAAHLAGEWSLVITFVLMASKVLDVGHHLSGVVDVNSWVDLRLVLGMGMFKPLSRQVRFQRLLPALLVEMLLHVIVAWQVAGVRPYPLLLRSGILLLWCTSKGATELKGRRLFLRSVSGGGGQQAGAARWGSGPSKAGTSRA